MATIRAYTTIEQSRKLVEILPLESADMYWDYDVQRHEYYPMVMDDQFDDVCIYAWSLTALLGALPKEIVYNKNIVYLEFHVWQNSLEYVNNADYILYITRSYDNAVDACCEMILKLNELNLL